MIRIRSITLAALVACSHPTTPPAPIVTVAPTPAPIAVAPPAPVHPARTPVAAPQVGAGYDKPPQHVLDVLHAPAPAQPVIAPTRDRILLVSWVKYPPIAQVSEPYLKLAGVRVEPRTRRKHDTPGGYGVAPCAQSFAMVDVATTKETPIALPADGCVDGVSWSADGRRFVFRNTARSSVELWLGDAVTLQTRRLDGVALNPMLGSSHQWLADQQTLLVKLAPDNAGDPPVGSVATTGPSIQETDGKSGEFSTYEARDTLNNKHDEDLFDYYGTSQLATVEVATGKVTRIGKPAVYTSLRGSPDGNLVLVEHITRPYSYAVTFERFAHDVDVWDRSGRLVKTLAKLPLAERVPVHGVPTGPRSFSWRSLEPATVVWAEALDGGDWNVKVPARDKVLMQAAPFTAPPIERTTEQRFAGFEWTENKHLALLHDNDENRHWQRTFTIDVDDPKAKPAVLFDLSSDEHYKDPGDPVYRPMPNGDWVVRLDGDAVYLSGQGSSREGDRPFLDRMDLKTKKADRLFQSDKAALEYFMTFAGDTKTFFTWHQTPSDPPNAYLRTIGSGDARSVTHIPDPTPAVRAIKKRLVKYKRKDGTELSFTLTTPPGYKEGTRVPAILYAYPLDYADAHTAGEITGSEQHFTQVDDYQLLLLSGYAIIDRAAFPIVGDPKKAYDTYLEQLVDDAKAAVDKAVELGVVDRDRIGVTGHSHGALMTVNLIAHTHLFRAGVATSGSYNKTLTPFGFQNERRSVWKATDVYLKVSPFFVADKIKLPLLIMHGADDANPGTTPLQAVKLYEAIRGNGGIARLVMLPHEPHWYSAMESNEQLAFEELRWFDKYVKNAEPNKPAGGTEAKRAKL